MKFRTTFLSRLGPFIKSFYQEPLHLLLIFPYSPRFLLYTRLQNAILLYLAHFLHRKLPTLKTGEYKMHVTVT